MNTLKPTVDAIWRALDMPPPLDEIGQSFEFELEATPVALRIEPNGQTVTVRGTLGYLDADAYGAQDQLRHILRLSLGLAAINGAALEVPDLQAFLDDRAEGSLPVFAVATAQLADPASSVAALREIVEWQGHADKILMRDRGDEGRHPAPISEADNGPEGRFVIFQP